jgi:hypothetical protein
VGRATSRNARISCADPGRVVQSSAANLARNASTSARPFGAGRKGLCAHLRAEARERLHALVAHGLMPRGQIAPAARMSGGRFDSPQMSEVKRNTTSACGPEPSDMVTSDRAGLAAWFERLFLVLRRRDRSLDFHLNQLVGEFFLLMARSLPRPRETRRIRSAPSSPRCASISAVRGAPRRSPVSED